MTSTSDSPRTAEGGGGFVQQLLDGLEGVAQQLRDEGHATAEKIQARIDEIKPMVASDIDAARTQLTDLIHAVFKPLP